MGIFNRKKSDESKMKEIASKVKSFMQNEENEGVSIVFVATCKEAGLTYVKGDKNLLTKAFATASSKDPGFKYLVDTTVKGKSTSKKNAIDLPDGSKAIVLEGDDIDGDLKRVIDEILKQNNIDPDES